MKKMKSAYEIAMEKANEIDGEFTEEEELMLKREELKPLLAKFYKGRLDADELWQKLKEKDDPELYREAQCMIVDSIGLKSTSKQLKKRKQGILALENLKGGNNTSFLEQALSQIDNLQQKYNNEREQLEKRIKNAVENAEMGMKPVQTQDGKTVMKLEPTLDEETKKQFKNARNKLENQSKEMLSRLLEEIKNRIK
ncbi:MAG: hypothetical protein ACOCQN_00030 [Halanaerobiaceae bacterium]